MLDARSWMLDAGEALPTAFTAGPPGSLARSMGASVRLSIDPPK
jgi:hypothetical protein